MSEILGIYIGNKKIGETTLDKLDIGNDYESDNFKMKKIKQIESTAKPTNHKQK